MDTPISTAAAPPRDGTVSYPRVNVASMAVLVFCAAQIVSTIDRGMLALIIDPIRHDLMISEVQIALLQGLAFGIFYVSIGLPLGAVADIVNRRKMLIAGILIWTIATTCGGLAQNFGQMFLSRLIMGFGEAVLAPCAVTMIGDLFPPSRRGRPMAVYILGSMIAIGLGSLVSGVILGAAQSGAFDAIPFLRNRAPWRIDFLLIGSSGFVIVFLVFLLKEPARTGIALQPRKGIGLKQAALYLKSHWRVFLPFYTSLSLYNLGGAAAFGWGAVLLTRVYGFSLAGAGKALGTAQIIAALLGALCASILVDRIVRRAGTGGKIVFGGMMSLLAIPSTIAFLAPSPWLAVAMVAEINFVSAMFGATMLSTTTEMVPASMKGVSVALYAFVMTMVGGTLGPLAVAQLTENIFRNPASVGRSMALVGVSALMLSSGLAFVSYYFFRRELARQGAFARVVSSNT